MTPADQQITEYARQEAAIMARMESLRTMMTEAIGRLVEEFDAIQMAKWELQDREFARVDREIETRKAAA